jgi:hypothetical protein
MLIAPAPFTEDDIRCLFTKPTVARLELEENLRAGWPAGQVPALLERILTSGLVGQSPSDRTRYRLIADMPIIDWHKLLTQPVLPVPPVGESTLTNDANELDASVSCFSVYRGGIKSVKPCGTLTPTQLHAELTSGRLRPQTEQLRAVGRTSPTYSSLKNRLDYVTPGGRFTHRAETGLVASSGLIVLDFDKLPDLPAARAALLADSRLGPVVKLLFTSPSGDGLKCLLPTDPRYTHLENFNGLTRYLSHKYADLGLIPDRACKDISRACYLAHDPDAYLNPEYQSPSKLAA